MKTFYFVLLLLGSMSLQAQDSTQLNRFWNNTEIGLLIGGLERSFTGLQILSTTGYRLSNNFSLGFTTGIDANEIAILPLLLHSRWHFAPTKRVNPYLGASAGWGIGLARKTPSYDTKGGFIGEISAGLQINRGKQTGFSLALAYRWQQYQETYNYFNVEEIYHYKISRLCFRFGWHF